MPPKGKAKGKAKAQGKTMRVKARGKAKGKGAPSRALLCCLAQWRLRNLETELGGVMLPRLSKLVLGGVIKTIALEAAKQKAKWRTVKRQWVLTAGKGV